MHFENEHSHGTIIKYCSTRQKKDYFASVKFDAWAKWGQQSHE